MRRFGQTSTGVTALTDLTKQQWDGYFQRLRREVSSDKIETFNGTYGLSRGLVVAALLVAAGVALTRLAEWLPLEACCGIAAIIYTMRMVRFARI